MKLFLAVLLLAAGASASLNCTVINAPLEEKSCAYPACPATKKYAVGDMIMAACRSDCSTDTEYVQTLLHHSIQTSQTKTSQHLVPTL
jgi:hypothetical protein